MQEFIITTRDALQTLVIDAVNTCLDYRTPPSKKPEPIIIDRDELCRRLSITQPTAIRWERKGRIPSFRVGSSVRYNWISVIDALEKAVA